MDWNVGCRISWFGASTSLPLRKCGLKRRSQERSNLLASHFPCGSVDWNVMLLTWIARQRVTSLAEVWIETPMSGIRAAKTTSLPLRKCGLKHTRGGYLNNPANVTSLAEVWIETETHRPHYHLIVCHFPCGSVDWNYAKKEVDRLPVVTSLAEVWIETAHSGPGKT